MSGTRFSVFKSTRVLSNRLAKNLLHPTLSPYWAVRGFLTLDNELLLYGNRIVVPSALQKDTIEKIHFVHQGIERCQQRVRSSVWWPGVSAQIKQKVLQCQECTKSRRVKREPLMSTPLPDYPWQLVATDLFELNMCWLLIIFRISSGHQTLIHHMSCCHRSLQITIFPIWNS